MNNWFLECEIILSGDLNELNKVCPEIEWVEEVSSNLFDIGPSTTKIGRCEVDGHLYGYIGYPSEMKCEEITIRYPL